MTARRRAHYTGDLREAVRLLEPGDPPLRWREPLPWEAHSAGQAVCTWAKRIGLVIRTFTWDGELWVVKLTGERSCPPASAARSPIETHKRLAEALADRSIVVRKEDGS